LSLRLRFSLICLLACGAFAQQPIADPPPAAALDRKPSEYLNERLPPWLQFSGEFRLRWEESGASGFNNPEDSYLLGRTRFDLAIKPLPWLKFFGQAQDARAYFQNVPHPVPSYQDTWDIRQAYVQIGDAKNGPIALTAGRQAIDLGDERLVGSSNWTNTARSFDAARLSLRHAGYRLDAFAASVVDQHDQELNHHTKGNNLHGLYGGLDSLLPGATIEPYLLWRLAPLSLSGATEHGGRGKLNEKTAGVRWVGKLPAGFDYNIEMAKQFGSFGLDGIHAWAGHWVVGKKFASPKWQPRLFLEYNYASGDANSADGTRGTFDELYPTSHGKYGLADQVGWRNIHDPHIGLDLKPAAKLTIAGGFHDYWLASARDGLYNSGGTLVSRAADGSAGRHVGQELDVYGAYSVGKAISFGAGYGRLFTGEFLNRTTRGHDYNYAYTFVVWQL
jgi:alginate export protein